MSEASYTWEVCYVDGFGRIVRTIVFHDIERARELRDRDCHKVPAALGYTIRHTVRGESAEPGLHEADR
jgi:hypothetical protein